MYYHSCTKNSLTELVKYALQYAKDKSFRGNLSDYPDMVGDDTEFDVFNCLNVMDNHTFLKELKFGAGDGSLHYYMFNYVLKAPGYMDAKNLCTVLV